MAASTSDISQNQRPDDIYAAQLHTHANGQSVLILTDDNTHDLELFYPYYRFIEEGYEVDVATPTGGEVKGKFGMGLKETRAIADVDPQDYCLLYIPGGKAPAALKENPDALKLARAFAETGRPIAALCHGPQVLVSAGLARGRRMAAWPEVRGELEEGGGEYVNSATVTDGQFITGRWPGDLPSHLAHTLQVLRDEQIRHGNPVSVLRASQGAN